MLNSVLILDPPHHSVDDLCQAFRNQLSNRCSVVTVPDLGQLLEDVKHRKHHTLVLVHAERGDGEADGPQVLKALRDEAADLPIVAIADRGDVEAAAAAIRAGAIDFLVRGPQLDKRVSTLLGKLRTYLRAIDRATTLDEQNTELQATIDAQLRIVGESPQMNELIQRIRSVAQVPRPLLIIGERGTGKELVARAIHYASPTSDGPIITVNCAAFSDALLESELFGHEKGAFTGADEVRHGKFAQADGGTLFLDEIGHMSLPFQRKVLRVVEYGTYTRVGGHQELETSARVVAATNVDLKEKIRKNEFLNDLYDRLAFEIINVPPLRDREGDILILSRYFLDQFALEIPNFAGKQLSASALRQLRKYPFPGNVRELKNIIERAAYRDTTNEITPEDIGMLSEEDMPMLEGTFEQRVDAFTRKLIEDALRDSGGNQAEAARRLSLSYHQFRYYRAKYLGDKE